MNARSPRYAIDRRRAAGRRCLRDVIVCCSLWPAVVPAQIATDGSLGPRRDLHGPDGQPLRLLEIEASRPL